MPARGDTLEGDYQLVEKIGEGGMGTVWLARKPNDPAEYAIKILHATMVDDARSIERFRLEAKASAEVNHENVCAAVSVGAIDGVPFLVMPRLVGESVADRLMLRGPMREREAMEVIVQVLAALEAAHARGILHRDLKPENVFLAREVGEPPRVVVKVLDFGVAKFIGGDAERIKLTRTGALIGTPAYMSPEQALGHDDVDARADVWAVGVLLFEMLTRELPFEGANYNALLVNIATRMPRSLSTLRANVDRKVLAIVEHALQRDRDKRIDSARTMREAVRAWLDGGEHPSMQSRPASLPPVDEGGDTAPPRARDMVTLAGKSRRSLAVPLVTAGVISLAAVSLWNLRRQHAESATVVRTVMLDASTALAPQPVALPDVPVASAHAEIDAGMPSAPRTYVLEIRQLPADAEVRMNGARVASLPAQLPPNETVELEVRAQGFEPWTQRIVAEGNTTVYYGGRALPVIVDAGTHTVSASTSARTPRSTTPRAQRDAGRGQLENDPGI